VACTETHVVVRSGLLWRRLAVVPHHRIQSARVTQGPWQRRLRLASLRIDTAGSRIKTAAAHRDEREAVDLAQQSARRARLAM
jgi:putative membrane protein